MADYCQTVDVIRELPYITINASSKPSSSEVDQFCVDVSAEMNARLRAVGISVPVVDDDLLAILLPIAINGVVAKVLRANQDGEFENAKTYEDLYQEALKRIEARPSILREDDSPGEAEGTAREDTDISFTRTGEDW